MGCKRSFSLIELATVLLLIIILAAFGLASFRKAIVKEREKRAKKVLQAIVTAEKDYFNYAGEYTNNFKFLDITPPADAFYNFHFYLGQGYIKAVPKKSGLRAFCINLEGKFINCSSP